MPANEKPFDASRPLEASAALWQFAGMPPVNPRDRGGPDPGSWQGLAGLAADLDYYGRRVREAALAASGEIAGERTAALSGLAERVRQVRPYVVQDQIDHYSTGSSSPYATVERDVAAYADAIVSSLLRVVDACAEGHSGVDPLGDAPGSWVWHLRAVARATQPSTMQEGT